MKENQIHGIIYKATSPDGKVYILLPRPRRLLKNSGQISPLDKPA